MLQPLMALLAVVSPGAAGGTATPPRCTVETEAGPITVLRAEDCAELTRLREERDTLRQRLDEVQRELEERGGGATGGSGEEGAAEPPRPAGPVALWVVAWVQGGVVGVVTLAILELAYQWRRRAT